MKKQAMPMIDALELLADQHREVEELISQIEDSDDSDERRELFREMANKLAAHSVIEEKIFYPSAMTDATRESLVEATEEHLAVKRVLADMLALDVFDEHFDAKLTVLKELVRHHVHDEEEAVLFPKVRRMMNKDERAALGNELLAMFETLLEREPRKQVPSETRAAAQL